MRTRSTLFAFGFALALAGCASAKPQARPSTLALSDCSNLGEQTAAELYAGKVTRVEPMYRQEFIARAVQPRYVAGAHLYVPAEPGVSRAYLERVLTCHAAKNAGSLSGDPFGVAGVVKVGVSEAGPAMRIAVVGEDRAAGKEIWQRAVALAEQKGAVTVEQL